MTNGAGNNREKTCIFLLLNHAMDHPSTPLIGEGFFPSIKTILLTCWYKTPQPAGEEFPHDKSGRRPPPALCCGHLDLFQDME